AMCGHDWCSVRISKEIEQFISGKDDNYARDQPKVTEALTAEQQEILKHRGVLSPAEIHKLATKTKQAMTSEASEPQAPSPRPQASTKPSCHSDYVDDDEAKKLQQQKLVQVDVRPAMNIPRDDSVI
ncbi:MAG: thiamine biosynthesis protein ThiC, partial [Phycisphaeraceae bacterium]